MIAILYASLIACATLVAWMYVAARDADEVAERWKAEAEGWQSLAEDANDSAARARGFAQGAVTALAQTRNALDERDALIEAQEIMLDDRQANIERMQARHQTGMAHGVAATIRYGQSLQRGELTDLGAMWPRLQDVICVPCAHCAGMGRRLVCGDDGEWRTVVCPECGSGEGEA